MSPTWGKNHTYSHTLVVFNPSSPSLSTPQQLLVMLPASETPWGSLGTMSDDPIRPSYIIFPPANSLQLFTSDGIPSAFGSFSFMH